MMWKKVSIFVLLATVALVHVSRASPTELPSSLDDEQVTESTTPSSGADSEDVVVVEARADDDEDDGNLDEMESGTESGEAREFDPSDCLLEKSTGPCRAAIDSWFFNAATKACESFLWSGCGGNKNRFRERSQCEKHCINGSRSTAGASNNETPDVMILNVSAPSSSSSPSTTSSTEDVGTTMSSETTAAESSTTSTTTSSTSTTAEPTTTATTAATTTLAPPKKKIGCPKFEGCAAKCIVVQEQSSGGCKKCQCPLPDESATSSVKITRSVSKTESQQAAVAAAAAAAKSPSVGSVSGQPAHAVMGEENDDGEDSSADTTERPEEICKLPATRGHCRAMMTRYRYDPKVKDCVQFHFGGCEGNANNFVTKEKCLEFCKGQ